MLCKKKDNIGPYTVTFQHKEGSYAETYRVKDNTGKTRFLKLCYPEVKDKLWVRYIWHRKTEKALFCRL